MKEEQRAPQKWPSPGAEEAARPELHFVWTDRGTENPSKTLQE